MKAIAVYPESHKVRLIEIPEPRLTTPTDVIVEILDVGICGTDREICDFHYGTPPEGEDFLVIGHESLGRVAEVGSGVSHVKKGDLVVSMVRRPCPHESCRPCRSGRPDFCVTGDYKERGIKGMHGYMTERVVVEEAYLVPVPADLRHVGVLVEPLTIAEKAFIQGTVIQDRVNWHTAHGRTALVLGAGPVGLLGAMVAVSRGFTTFAYSREEEDGPKGMLLKSIGATLISASTSTIEQMTQRVGGIDVVYEACGASKLAFDVLAKLDANGVFCFTGVPGRRNPVTIDTDLLMRNMVLLNQVLFGTVNAGKDSYEAAVRDLADFEQRWPKSVERLITKRFPITEFENALHGGPGSIKQIVTFDRG